MRKHLHGVIAAILVAVMLICTNAIMIGFTADSSAQKEVTYSLYVTDYRPQDDGTVKMDMQLYVNYYNNGGMFKYTDRGSFGLRFPAGMEIEFTPNSKNIELFPYYPTTDPTEYLELKKSGQHFFMWTVTPDVKRVTTSVVQSKTVEVFGESVDTQGVSGGAKTFIGTYTLTLEDDFPSKNSIDVLDWNNTEVSKSELYTKTDGVKSLNGEVWNDTDEDGEYSYQGHYADSDYEMHQIDMPLVFTAPDYWPNALFNVLSYDPKKPMELTLNRVVEVDGQESLALVTNSFTVPTWNETDKDNTSVYAAAEGNVDTGTGPYYTAVELETAEGESLSAGTYEVEIRKDGHLTQKLSLTLDESGSLSEIVGMSKDEPIYLPAGDINPIKVSEEEGANTLYGDGRIDMADRAQVLCHLGTAAAEKEAENPASYYADIDGDGRVTQADLSILVSPQNYGKYIN